MIKKLLIAIMLLLPAVMHAEGWIQHPQFLSSGIKNNVDAVNCVYMLVNNNLSRYDKTTGEIQLMKKSTGLSEDAPVTQIYYNYNKQYLLVLYLNLNMDVIMSDGSVVNVPALRDMLVQGCDKTVNDVTFGGGNIYVATAFGYFVMDDATLTTKAFRNYGTSIRSIAPVSGGLAAAMGDSLYFSRTQQPEKLSDFKSISLLGNRDTCVYNNNNKGKPVKVTYAKLDVFNNSRLFLYVMCNLDSSYVKRVEILQDGENVELNRYQYARNGATQALLSFQASPTGYIWNLVATNATYFTTDANGETYKSVNGRGSGIYTCNPAGDGELWGLGANGLFKNTAATTYYKANSHGLALPFWATYHPQSGRVYMNNAAASSTLNGTVSTNATKFTAFTYDGNQWRENGCIWRSGGAASQKNSSGYRITFDPRHPDTYYVGTWYGGMYKVVNDTVAEVFDERNSPIVGAANNYYRCIKGYGFDSQGNLWMVQNDDGTAANGLAAVLPVDKLENTSHTVDDFIKYNIPGVAVAGSKYNMFAIGKDDVKVFCPGDYKKPIILWRGDLNGEQESKSYTQVRDQNNSQFAFSTATHPFLTNDSTGLIWVGASRLFYFDPTTAFGDDLHVTRPVNASGEFVLDGISINQIEVDHLNRKWVSTTSNGLYLLSADGTEILKHFTTDNSMLPSNVIYTTCAMGTTGNLMIITSNGVVEYMEDYQAEETLGNLSVYPNPVLPDFTGLVTIEGVARGQHVKICNRQGEVVKEITRDGDAVVTWDACDDNGERVETGVYAIYVSTDDGQYPAVPQLQLKVVK